MSDFAQRGALRGGGMPTMNVDAQTNPKAKTIPTIRYVLRKRASRTDCQRLVTKAWQEKSTASPPGIVGMVRQNRLRASAGRTLRLQAIGGLLDLRQDLLHEHLALGDPIEAAPQDLGHDIEDGAPLLGILKLIIFASHIFVRAVPVPRARHQRPGLKGGSPGPSTRHRVCQGSGVD